MIFFFSVLFVIFMLLDCMGCKMHVCMYVVDTQKLNYAPVGQPSRLCKLGPSTINPPNV